MSERIDAHAVALSLMREALSLLDDNSAAVAHLEQAIAAVELAEDVRASDADKAGL